VTQSVPDTTTYPWFQPKPLADAIRVRLTFGDFNTPELSIGRLSFSESGRVHTLVRYPEAVGANWLRPPVQAPYYIRAGMEHRYRFEAVLDTNEPAGLHLPVSVEIAMWAPRSKNRNPDRHLSVPVVVHRS
jgi:hypothetical protein